MAIYGNTISFGGGGGSNDTLPPLLDNFKATRLEGGLVPPVSNAVAFKDIPDGSKIKLVKGSKISGTVTYGKTTDLNHRIVFDSNDWTKKEFQLENDSGHNNISGSDIDQWLNATKASGWWTNQSTNTTSPDYANEQGFLYQLGITDELLAQNFNDININETNKAKVGLPWSLSAGDWKYTFFNNASLEYGGYWTLWGADGGTTAHYDMLRTRVVDETPLSGTFGKIHPMMEPKPETKVALDVDGSYFMFEKQTSIVLSADKMPVSRANALAGAVWVYGEHEPKNVNDGTKINLTREEIVLPEEGDTDIPPISYTELERPTSTKTWTATEDGYYKFVGVAEAGRSGTARRIAGASYNVSGGSGGSGGIVASVFKLKRGESVSLTVTGGDVTISYGSETANATHGQDGGSSSSEPDNKVKLGIYGKPGTATGGNLINMNGKPGIPGERLEGNKATIVRGGETIYEKHISSGGYAQSTRQEGDMVPADRGTTAYIAVLKGDSSSNKPLNFTTKATKTISMLPSKSKVKLGRYKGKTLIWDKGTTQSGKTVLTTNKETSTSIIPKTFQYDNREPQNPSSTIRQIGNARYLWSNVRQWLNAKGTGWYKSQHTYDAPPTYQNEAGFLTDWDDKDLSVIKQGSWKSFSGVDGNNTLDTITDKIAIIGAGEIVDSFDHSNFVRDKIDWAKSLSDIAINAAYWTRDCTTAISGRVGVVGFQGNINTGGYAGVQDTGMALMLIAEVNPDTRVSENPDSDGCYTINFEPEFSKQVEKQVQWDTNKNFYARQFTYNSKKQYQTMLEGATAELLLGEVPLPVSNLTISENAGASPTLSWKNPTDKNYHETVVVQKEGSTPPRSTDDGIEVYRGNDESVTVKDLQSTVDYSFGVFTLSQYGNYGEPVTISYRYDFPSEPTSYSEIEKIRKTTQWIAPEDGYFRFVGVATSGSGGRFTTKSHGAGTPSYYSGGSGGSGGIVVSDYTLNKGDIVEFVVNGDVSFHKNNENIAKATRGTDGRSARYISSDTSNDRYYNGAGGTAGTASGGNVANVSGTAGNTGVSNDSGGGAPVRTVWNGYYTSSGFGAIYRENRTPGTGTAAYAVVLRGNTNIPSPQ